jgi:L-2-hydroxyglutarate oxidase LhgO
VAGREQLYQYCESRDVPHRRCGKLIVATTEPQLAALAQIAVAAAANGVELERLSAVQAQALEPQVHCVGALHSPLTGIIDSHSYMLSLLGEAEQHGATLVCGSRVTGGTLIGGASESERIVVTVEGAHTELRARLLVNCASLGATSLARSIAGFPAEHVPRDYLAKGTYFTLSGRSPFSRLVYPIPEPGGLGIHLTLDLAGRARFGPDVEWIDTLDYTVQAQRSERFYGAVRTYWPALPDGALEPAYAGIRPKIAGPGEPSADFRIEGGETHGIGPVIHLFGIESPGLTASLAIAARVADLARTALD